MHTVVTSRLRIETKALSTMDHMTSLEAIIPSAPRTFWNSNDPSLGPFDDVTLAMGSADEACCSSTFQHLFPHSTGDSSTSDESEEPMFTTAAPSHPSFISLNVEAGGSAAAEDQSSLVAATAHDSSYCTNDVESSLFTWSLPSSPPHYQAGELAPGNYDGGLDPSSIFGPCAPDQVPFLKVPQPSFGAASGKDHRNSWQLSTMSESRIFHHAEQPLGSPCSVISGFTKALQEGENLYNMALDQAGFSLAADQSISGTLHHVSCGVHKRKRSKVPKHSSEVESQRMTHIAVERNRRKQMNEHLAALRALMPGSYVQKGDQASIVGGAIEFVKELEHLLVCLQSQKRRRAYSDLTSPRTPTSRLAILQPDPQPINQNIITQPSSFSFHNVPQTDGGATYPGRPGMIVPSSNEVGEAKSEAASVEVRLVAGAELQALVKVMALRRSGQLLRTVVAMESLALTVVHANITTVNHTVLYSFQAHVGPLCRLTSHDIAAALHQTFASLHALQF